MLFKKRFVFSFYLCSAMILCSGSSFAQDQCADVLLLAAKNTFSFSSGHSISSAAKSFFCSDSFYSHVRNSSAGLSLTVPVEGIPFKVGGEGSNQDSTVLRERFCASSSSSFSEEEAMSLFSQVVEPEAIKAWSDCMSNHSMIQMKTYQTIGEEFYLMVKFNIRDERSRNLHPVIYSVFASNAKDLGGDWEKNKEVGVSGLIHRFRRIDDSLPMSVFLSTSEGVSNTVLIQPKKVPLVIGSIQATWEEPYQAESSQTKEMYVTSNPTENLHEQHRYQYSEMTLNIEDATEGSGYLKDLKMTCISEQASGACAHHDILELKLTSYKTAYVRWRTSSWSTVWRLSAQWVYYQRKFRKKTSSAVDLVRGSQVSLSVPNNAINVRIFGKTLDGSFDYTPGTIRNSKWLNFNGVSNSQTENHYDFSVNQK